MQFGFIAIYLSESFVRGFMTAAGLQILISVLKYIFGIKVPPYSGPLAVIYVSDSFMLRSKNIRRLWWFDLPIKRVILRLRHRLSWILYAASLTPTSRR